MKFTDHSIPKDARFGNNLSCSFQEVKNVQRIDINGAICHMSDSGDLLVFFSVVICQQLSSFLKLQPSYHFWFKTFPGQEESKF